MKKQIVTLGLLSQILYAGTSAFAESRCPAPWTCQLLQVPASISLQESASIRAGFIEASPKRPFQGNILYFEGLGDSMLNHLPLFNQLTEAGYRVVAFDYPGQGGSTGSMNQTRIKNIPAMGEIAWKKYARETETYSQKTILGWSTGGLAAYWAASQGQADRIILIAPALSPKAVMNINLTTMTSEKYNSRNEALSDGTQNPHVDALKPTSPLNVPLFTTNLLYSAATAKNWVFPKELKAFVLVSGDKDSYVKSEKTMEFLNRYAPHFSYTQYEGALHEIDNEVPTIREKAFQDILNFLGED